MSAPRFAALALTVLVAVSSPARAARFAVYGDTRNNPAVHAKVVEDVAASKSEFALFTGDAVLHGDTPAEWVRFDQMEAPILDGGLNVYAVRGNHDTGPLFAQHFVLPPPGAHGTENYYAFDALGVHFIGMDTEGDDSAGGTQYTFVKSDLEAHAGLAPIVVYLHRALYSSGHHGDDTRLLDTYAPLFKDAHVVAVFQGHDHDYERSKPIDGVTYFVEGGGGADQRPFEGDAPPWSAFRAMVFGYATVDVLPNALEVHAYDENNLLLDQVTLPFSAMKVVDAGPPLRTPPPVPVAPPPPAPVPVSEGSSSGGFPVGAIILGLVLLGGLAFAIGRGRGNSNGK